MGTNVVDIKSKRLKYDDLGEDISPMELTLIQKHESMFYNPKAMACPLCGTGYSPIGGDGAGPCIDCVEERFERRVPIKTSHLPKIWPAGVAFIKMAHDIINEQHPLAKNADIAYLMKAKHSKSNGKIVLGSCAKQSEKNKLLHGWDYIIEIAWDMFTLFTQQQKEALLFHELCHIDTDDESEKWTIAPHSVEEHVRVIERYGLWRPDLAAFAEAISRIEAYGNEGQSQIFEEV